MGDDGDMNTHAPLDDIEALAGCCSPVTAGVVTDEVAVSLAKMFKALGDPARVKLISLIAASPDGEACVCDLTGPVGLAQPTISHHMKQLVEAGLVSREQRGRWAYYRIQETGLTTLGSALAHTN